MHAVELTIGDITHRLPRNADEDAVLAELTAAVQAGGGVVVLPTSREHSTVAVLVSPGVPIFIERMLIPDEPTRDLASSDDTDLVDWADF